jgi:hypothetical protein
MTTGVGVWYHRTRVREKRAMSAIRSALEELQAQDLRHAADEELHADLEELHRAAQALEAERLRRVAEVDRRQSCRREGYLSTAVMLADRLRIPWSAAGQAVRTALALEEMPLTREAFAAGEVPCAALRELVAARETNAEAFRQAEPVLVDAARSLPPRQFRHAVAYWRQAADPVAALDEEEERVRRRRLSVSRTFFGMVRIDGDLDPETGETVITALRSVQDAGVRTGEGDVARSATQWRADALGELCRHYLDTADRSLVAGERPHVTVTVDVEAL